LVTTGLLWSGLKVLCLGARLGTEVKAFHDLGCFAVGIDLNPGLNSRHVLNGDFHALQFPSGSVDLVFTNSLDHAFDAERVLAEVRRVLVPGGVLLLDVVRGEAEGIQPDAYTSLWWSDVETVVDLVRDSGFHLVARQPFTIPWPGGNWS
jgi:SAM-dependent methyltransferase